MNLVKLRVENGLTQQDLADISGVSQPNIAAMERGTRPLTARMFERIKTAVEKSKPSESALDLAVQAAFSKPHLVAMRNEHNQEQS